MHIYLVDGEMLLCMPIEMIIVGANLKGLTVICKKTKGRPYIVREVINKNEEKDRSKDRSL